MSPFLPDDERAALAAALEATRRQTVVHVTRDSCERCGGLGCDECRWCDCHACYRPEYARASTVWSKP